MPPCALSSIQSSLFSGLVVNNAYNDPITGDKLEYLEEKEPRDDREIGFRPISGDNSHTFDEKVPEKWPDRPEDKLHYAEIKEPAKESEAYLLPRPGMKSEYSDEKDPGKDPETVDYSFVDPSEVFNYLGFLYHVYCTEVLSFTVSSI